VEKQKQEVSVSKPLPQIVSHGDDEDDLEDTEANERYIDSDEDPDAGEMNENSKNPRGKMIEPLARVDHSHIHYKSFKKAFYREAKEIASMTEEQVQDLREELEVSVLPSSSSSSCPRPIQSFNQLGFPPQLLKEIERQGFEKPTPIQAQSMPIVLSGHDLIGLAKTGSGKTLAYVWPMIIHILDQPQMTMDDGPIALILVPTRELASQIHGEVKKFARIFNIRLVAIYGGAGKYEMSKSLREEKPEVVIATPGRFIEMIKMKATNIRRTTYVVVDESDRLFEMGFEYQIRSILHNVQPKRQLLMFSATMKKRIEAFAREMFTNGNEVRVSVGRIGEANHDIQQTAHIVANDQEKWLWLASEIDEFTAEGKVLIFVLSKDNTELLAKRLKDYFLARQLDIGVDCLHGDKDQYDRTSIMKRFTKSKNPNERDDLTILVATDIASRGLDIKNIRTVVNYDVAKNIETYVHRIGRTGRMGIEGVTPGTAHTLLTPKDASFAVDLVQNLRLSQQPVSEELVQLAMKDAKWYKIKHFSGGKAIGMGGHRGGSGTVGMGMGQRALTSQMMAQQSQQALNINLPKGLENVFRVADPSLSSSSSAVAGEKRKSRFSDGPAPAHLTVPALPVAPSVSTIPQQSVPSHYQSSSSVLQGFVRSSTAYSSTTPGPSSASNTANNPLMKAFVKSSSDPPPAPAPSSSSYTGNQSNSSDQARKKSRWG
jgi:ATP-dependent RNA helicase DDX42